MVYMPGMWGWNVKPMAEVVLQLELKYAMQCTMNSVEGMCMQQATSLYQCCVYFEVMLRMAEDRGREFRAIHI